MLVLEVGLLRGSASRSNSCTGGRRCSSGDPGTGALRPPDPGARHSFQPPLANRERSVPGLDHHRHPPLGCCPGLSEDRKEADAVLPGIFRERTSDDLRECREDIDEADHGP